MVQTSEQTSTQNQSQKNIVFVRPRTDTILQSDITRYQLVFITRTLRKFINPPALFSLYIRLGFPQSQTQVPRTIYRRAIRSFCKILNILNSSFIYYWCEKENLNDSFLELLVSTCPHDHFYDLWRQVLTQSGFALYDNGNPLPCIIEKRDMLSSDCKRIFTACERNTNVGFVGDFNREIFGSSGWRNAEQFCRTYQELSGIPFNLEECDYDSSRICTTPASSLTPDEIFLILRAIRGASYNRLTFEKCSLIILQLPYDPIQPGSDVYNRIMAKFHTALDLIGFDYFYCLNESSSQLELLMPFNHIFNMAFFELAWSRDVHVSFKTELTRKEGVRYSKPTESDFFHF